MLIIEDLSADALPDTTDETVHPSQTAKYQQIGCDAYKKLIRSFTNGLSVNRKTLTFVDLHAHVGDGCRALMLGDPIRFYVGYCMDEMSMEWLQMSLMQYGVSLLKDGTMTVPGYTTPGKDLPADQVEPLPPKPVLNVLTWSGYDAAGLELECLKLPEKFMQQYHDHPVFKDKFQEWLKHAVDNCYLNASKADPHEAKPSPSKRPFVENGPARPLKQAKTEEDTKIKTEELTIVPVSQVPGPLLHSVAMSSIRNADLKLVVAAGHAIFISNEKEDTVKLAVGMNVAGYYRGKWARQKDDKPDETAEHILFQINDADDIVLMGGKMSRIGDLLLAKMKTSPQEACVKYHKTKASPRPGDPAHIEFEQVHKVLYMVQPVPTKADGDSRVVVQGHVAGVVPHRTWDTSCTGLIWAVKWGPVGIVPVRPHVMVTAPFEVPAGKAVKLSMRSETKQD